MSGHSKFANIKHKKEKNDAAKGKIFTIIGREIAVAVKEGGPDPANNYKLSQIIAKAKSNNMPNDTIERGIKKASGEGMNVNYEDGKRIVDFYKLNKPVYYIFEDINFDSALRFNSSLSYVIFRNCTFNKNIGILWADNLTFENNKYLDRHPIYFYGKCFLFYLEIVFFPNMKLVYCNR